MHKHPTGSQIFDELLDGGYENGVVTVLYGPAGSGKSNLTLLALTTIEKRAVFIDTESSFSIDRLQQLTPRIEKLLEKVVLLRAHDFEQQHSIITKLPKLIQDDIEIIVIDGIAAQYRAAIAQNKDNINSRMAQQLHTLFTLAAKKDIPILITSQVYADMENDAVKIVGGDIVKYSTKCMIELQNNETRKAILRKHRSMPAGKTITFQIENVGIYEKTS